MEKVSFQIFIPQKQPFRLTPNWIVYGLWLITIIFFWLFDDYFPPHSDFKSYWLALVFVITMYFIITSFFTYEPLNGSLGGELIFEESCVRIDGVVYELRNIKKVDFNFVDFYGDRYMGSGNFDPGKKQGVDNFFLFNDDAGQSQKVYFKQVFRNQYKDLYPFINEAVKVGAMTYYRAIDLIDVENVTKP